MRLIWLIFCIRFALKSVAITLVDKFDDNIYLNVDNVKTNFMFQNMNSEEEDMVIIVVALNLIKRKRYKKYKNSRKKHSRIKDTFPSCLFYGWSICTKPW